MKSISFPSEIGLHLESVRTPQQTGGASFSATLEKAVEQLDKTQTASDTESTRLALGGGNLHETALAMEKADIAIRLATKVRNKAVEAYQDVMRMGV